MTQRITLALVAALTILNVGISWALLETRADAEVRHDEMKVRCGSSSPLPLGRP